jgi:hypothetical protein
VNAVNFPRALLPKLQRYGNVIIDHRSVRARIDQEFTARFPTEFIIVPAPRTGDQRTDRF